MAYTHSGAHSRIEAQIVVNTWGKEHDGFFATCNATYLFLSTFHLTHKGAEASRNM